MTARRARLTLVVSTLLLPAVLGAAQWLHSPSVLARASRRKAEATRQRWTSALREPSPAGTYAALALPSGNTLWSEMLMAAGVPAPMELPPTAALGESSYRLLVVADEPPGAALRLARPGRAVIGVAMPSTPLRGSIARWNGLVLPIEGERGRVLQPADEDVPMLVSDAGETLAMRRLHNGGVVLQLGVDLAAVLLRLRQGEPERAMVHVEQGGPIQASDLVRRLPDELTERPWADELVDGLLEQLDRSLPCPLPRTAGLPDDRPVVVLTADQDLDEGDVLLHMSNVLQTRSAGATFLLAHPGPNAPPGAHALSRDVVTELLANGHGVGVHPLVNHPEDISPTTAAIGGLAELAPIAVRHHLRAWLAGSAAPQAQAGARLMIDLDLAPSCTRRQPCAAFIGGSTRPMRFVGPDGRLLPVLQQPTSVDDSSLRDPDLNIVRATGAALGLRALEMLKRAAAADGPLVVDVHPTLFAVAGDWAMLLIESRANVMSAEGWLDFVARRRQSRITSRNCISPPNAVLQPGISLRQVRR